MQKLLIQEIVQDCLDYAGRYHCSLAQAVDDYVTMAADPHTGEHTTGVKLTQAEKAIVRTELRRLGHNLESEEGSMGRITWLKVNNEAEREEADQAPSLEKLQEFVGGYIELVQVLAPDNTPAQLIVNEEGHLLEKTKYMFNEAATEHYHRLTKKTRGFAPQHVIVGNAVLLEGDARLD